MFLLQAFPSLPFLGCARVVRIVEKTPTAWGGLVLLSVWSVLGLVLSPEGTTVKRSHMIEGTERLICLESHRE